MGVLGTSGSDPRERGRKRSRSEIEAASRAEYLAKKEHLAKIKGMRDTEKAAEAEKKTSAARARVLARPDVQEQIDAKEGNRLQQEARKAKKVERLTPEQSLAKGQAEKQKRDEIAAGPQFSTFEDSPQVKAHDALMYRLGYIPGDGGRFDNFLPSQTMQNVNRLRDAVMTPSSMFTNDPNIGGLTKKEHVSWLANNATSEQREIALRKAQREAAKQQASAPAAPATPAATATPAAATAAPAAPISDGYVMSKDRKPSFSFTEGQGGFLNDGIYQTIMGTDVTKSPAAMRPYMENPNYKPGPNDPDKYVDANGNDKYLFPENSAALKKHIEAELTNPMGSAIPKTPDRLATRVDDSGPAMAGIKKFGSDVGETLRGIKDTVDMGVGTGATQLGSAARAVKDTVDAGLGSLFEASAPQFDRANAGAARMGQGIADAGRSAAEFADRPLAEGGLRFDPGVAMPPQREVGGATGGSIGAPTKKRTGVNPTSIYELLDQLLPKAMKDPNSMYYFPGKYY
jgi:hypothetical protein